MGFWVCLKLGVWGVGFVFLLSLEFWGNPYFLSFRLKVEEGHVWVFFFF
jgi:hypothetical protein